MGATSLWPYLALLGVPNFVFVLVFAYIADIMPSKWRATYFAWFIAAFGINQFAANAICKTVVRNFEIAAATALASQLLALVVAFLVLPESLPPESRKPPINWRDKAEVLPVVNSLAQVRILGRTKIFRRVATALLVSTLAFRGVQAIQQPYLRQEVNFSSDEFETQSMIAGIAIVVTQLGLTPVLITWAGEQRTLVAGLVVSLCYVLSYATRLVHSVPTVYMATVSTATAALASLCLPSRKRTVQL
jgi:hypothetical protein